jgi:argininosuccinate lyase
MDATACGDWMMEALNSMAILQVHFSRLAEEFILWSSWEFRTVTLDDGFAMGSSMMPQKKNPGPLELMRGRAGRMIGNATGGMVMMKGLPSGYNRDFHEQKELLVASFEIICAAADVIPPLVDTTTINTDRMAEIASANFANATELANYLVFKHNMPFRHAHDVVGTLVGRLNRAGENFMSDFDTCVVHLKENGVEAPVEEIRKILDPKEVMLTYNSLGGTGKKAVQATMANLHKKLEQQKAELAADKKIVADAREKCRQIASEAAGVTDVNAFRKIVSKHL